MPTFSLLINTPAADDPHAHAIRFGGKPYAPEGMLHWPACTSCEGNMQFLGQLPVETRQGEDLSLLLFMCQNDPGLCDEWDADAGGNAVIVVARESMEPVTPPETGETVRSVCHGAAVVDVEAESYEHARENWTGSTGANHGEVLGQIGGQPAWLQAEELPSCDTCHAPMSFVAQLEEGPESETAMNFGGGAAYVYQCRCGTHQAKMLWQS
jgi:hypothetical protein